MALYIYIYDRWFTSANSIGDPVKSWYDSMDIWMERIQKDAIFFPGPTGAIFKGTNI